MNETGKKILGKEEEQGAEAENPEGNNRRLSHIEYTKRYNQYLEESGGDHKKAAAAFFKEQLQGKSLLCDIDGQEQEVFFTGKSWREIKRDMSKSPLKAEIVPHIQEILKSGDCTRAELYKERKDDVVAFYSFSKRIRTSAGRTLAVVDVKEQETNLPRFSVYSTTGEGVPGYEERQKHKKTSDRSPGQNPVHVGGNNDSVVAQIIHDEAQNEKGQFYFEIVNIRFADEPMEEEAERVAQKRMASAAYDDNWITVHGNGPDVKGNHVLLGEGGEVKAGLGGKFTGKHISQVKGKWAQAQGGRSAAGAAGGASGGGASGGSQGGEGSGGGENKPARNPKIPQDQSQLTQPMKILKETEKAYAVANPAYEKAKGIVDRHGGDVNKALSEMSWAERQAWRNNEKYMWIPKSQSTADNGEVVGMKQWVAERANLKTNEESQIKQEAQRERNNVIAQAKSLGIDFDEDFDSTTKIRDKIDAKRAEQQSSLKTSVSIPEGQVALKAPIPIIGESEKAYTIENPAYKNAQEKLKKYPNTPEGQEQARAEMTTAEIFALRNNKETLMVKKSGVTLENGQIVAATESQPQSNGFVDFTTWMGQLHDGQHTRNAKIPTAQRELRTPMTIIKETDKAYGVDDGDGGLGWIPKSRSTAEGGKLIGAERWLLDKKIYGNVATYDTALISFDASPSKRHKDNNGYLHVDASNITKEQVAPYYGDEIAGWQELELDPHKLYYMYRPAEELKKAAHTFNGMPILFEHHQTNADNPAKDYTIGSLGTDAEFRSPYIVNSLVFTDGEAIDAIERGEYKELSAAYCYTPVMRGGIFDGQKYDGVMTDIKANHVALVKEGRAGHDVIVADSKPEKRRINHVMKKTKRRIFAFDGVPEGAEVNLAAMMDAVEAVEAQREATEPEINADSSIDDIVDKFFPDSDEAVKGAVKAMLEHLKAAPAADNDPEEAEDNEEELKTSSTLEDEEGSEEGSYDSDFKQAMADCNIDADDPESAKAFAEGVKYGEKLMQNKAEREKLDHEHESEGMKKLLEDQKEELAEQKAAMDSKLKSMKEKTMSEMKAHYKALYAAAQDCRPVLGNIVDPMAFDSADDIYRKALTQVGVSTRGVHPSAYPEMLKLARKGMTERREPTVMIAADSAPDESMTAAAAGLARIQH